MKSILLKSFAGAGLPVFSPTATAQDRDRDDDSYHSDRDARFHEEHWRGQLFQRVREDVEHIRSVTWQGGGDEYRLGKTVEELNELQGKLANHVYDEREIDEVIDSLGRDRDILNDDLGRLREFREHRADWDR